MVRLVAAISPAVHSKAILDGYLHALLNPRVLFVVCVACFSCHLQYIELFQPEEEDGIWKRDLLVQRAGNGQSSNATR